MTFGSLFSGCGLMDSGLEEAGLTCRWQCEIDADARRALAHHWPQLPCHEDIREIDPGKLERVDMIVGGFPCQDLSVAGQRKGIKGGKRSGLWWEMLRVIEGVQPRVVLWENVPGLLSSDGGRDFIRVCSSLAQRGYFGCVRTLDARYFGVPQRRRRLFGVFVRDDPTAGRAAQILALTQSRSGHPPTRGEAGAGAAGQSENSAGGTGCVVNALDAHMGMAGVDDNAAPARHLLAIPIQEIGARTGVSSTNPRYGLAIGKAGDPMFSLQARHQHGVAIKSEIYQANGAGSERTGSPSLSSSDDNGTNQVVCVTNCSCPVVGENIVPTRSVGTGLGLNSAPAVAFTTQQEPKAREDGLAFAITADSPTGGGQRQCVAQVFTELGEGHQTYQETDVVRGLRTSNGGGGPRANLVASSTVRRLTPTECLRLMGAPDDWLDLSPPLSDSAKYRLCGNGVVRTVARWLGRRILASLEEHGL